MGSIGTRAVAFRPTWFTMCAAILAIDEDAHEIDKLDLVNIGKNGYQNTTNRLFWFPKI